MNTNDKFIKIMSAFITLYLIVRWLGIITVQHIMVLDSLISTLFISLILISLTKDEVNSYLLRKGVKFSIGVLALIVFVLSSLGLTVGLSINPIMPSSSYAINNLLFVIPKMLLLAVAVAIFSRFSSNKSSFVYSILILLSSKITFAMLVNGFDFLTLNYTVSVILPTVFEAVALVVIAKRYGVLSSISYMLVLAGSLWLNPLIPNVNSETIGLIYVIINVTAITYLSAEVHEITEHLSARQVREYIYPLVAISVLSLVFLVLMSHGYYMLMVLTGSMKPYISPGDIAIIGPGSLKPGSVVAYIGPAKSVVLHRIVNVVADHNNILSIVTKGDANNVTDPPVPPSAVLGTLKLHIPYVGLPLLYLAKRLGDIRLVGPTLLTILIVSYLFTKSVRKLHI